MLRLLRLYLPTLIPSWRFFKEIAPSPRIEIGLSPDPAAMPAEWREARPRPAHVSPLRMLRRMLWNPRWNETLFLTSLAERIVEDGGLHDPGFAEAEIARRLARDLGPGPGALRFRLVFVRREGKRLVRLVEHVSAPFPRAGWAEAPGPGATGGGERGGGGFAPAPVPPPIAKGRARTPGSEPPSPPPAVVTEAPAPAPGAVQVAAPAAAGAPADPGAPSGTGVPAAAGAPAAGAPARAAPPRAAGAARAAAVAARQGGQGGGGGLRIRRRRVPAGGADRPAGGDAGPERGA